MDVKSTTSIPSLPVAKGGESPKERRDEPKRRKRDSAKDVPQAPQTIPTPVEDETPIPSEAVVELLEKASETRQPANEKHHWNVKESSTETSPPPSKVNKSL